MFNKIKRVISKLRVKIFLSKLEETGVDFEMLQGLLIADQFMEIMNKKDLNMSIISFFGVVGTFLESMDKEARDEVSKCITKNIGLLNRKGLI